MGKIDYSIIGKRFGRLTVLELDFIDKSHYTHWKCKCDCGNIVSIRRNQLTSGDTISCGCYHKEHNHEFGLKHGLTKHPLYTVWSGIKNRCLNPNAKSYERYGARGITICDEWKNDFKAFYDWAMANGYRDDLTIDRINKDGNYEPSNCRWIIKFIGYKGVILTLTQWAEILGVNVETLRYRVNHDNFKDFESLHYMDKS